MIFVRFAHPTVCLGLIQTSGYGAQVDKFSLLLRQFFTDNRAGQRGEQGIVVVGRHDSRL